MKEEKKYTIHQSESVSFERISWLIHKPAKTEMLQWAWAEISSMRPTSTGGGLQFLS